MAAASSHVLEEMLPVRFTLVWKWSFRLSLQRVDLCDINHATFSAGIFASSRVTHDHEFKLNYGLL